MTSGLIADQLVAAAQRLAHAVARLKFKAPVAHVYNPLAYAWAVHEKYLRKFGASRKRVIFLGMNPGPFGMVQTGVPFGEIAAVRDWLKISGMVERPGTVHPKRPILGFECPRSEVSGSRLWGLFAERFGTAEKFFGEHFVANYCPLAFLDINGRNLPPDKFSAAVTSSLYAACDQHLRDVVAALQPEWVIGVGQFSEKRARTALEEFSVKFGRTLHPSPASPLANRGWSADATKQLVSAGVWSDSGHWKRISLQDPRSSA